MSGKISISTLILYVVLAILCLTTLTHSSPLVRRQNQIVAYADLLGGRVTITQLAQGYTRIYGQFNTGFQGSTSSYSIVFAKSGYSLSNKINYSILNGGTSAFQVDVTDLRLDNNGPGVNVAGDILSVYRNNALIGSGNV
ncbi:hypothetical protein G9A89_000310, partial [Geosiphon pyriformis]